MPEMDPLRRRDPAHRHRQGEALRAAPAGRGHARGRGGMKRSVQTRLVNFADCDPAQIVFYPRYFEWFDRGTEMLFRAAGLDWETLFATGNWNGVPILDAGANFKRPCRFGDTVTVDTWIEEWRGKTFLVRHQIRNRGELAAE